MLTMINQDHPLRSATEQVIREAYRREHNARLESFPTCLVAWIVESEIVCAASLRFRPDGFFSDCYLDHPIEDIIGHHVGGAPNPNTLVEVGNLAAVRPHDIGGFIHEIIAFAEKKGMLWAFFTATARLRAFLRRGGLPLIELAVADPARVKDVQIWGDYYRQDPRVMLVGKHMIKSLDQSPPVELARLSHA